MEWNASGVKEKAERKSLMPCMNAGCQCPLILSTVTLNTWKAASGTKHNQHSALSKKKDCRHRQSFFL